MSYTCMHTHWQENMARVGDYVDFSMKETLEMDNLFAMIDYWCPEK